MGGMDLGWGANAACTSYVCVVVCVCGIHAVKHNAMLCIISAGMLPNALTPSFLQRALINCQLTGGPKPKGF